MGAIKTFSVTAGLTAAWALSVWTNNYQEFSRVDSIGFSLHCFVVLLVQFLISTALFYLAKKRALPNISPYLLNAGFCVFNLYTLVLLHFENIASLRRVYLLFLLATLLITFYILLKSVNESAAVSRFAYAFILLFIIQDAGAFFWNQYEKQNILAKTSKLPEHLTFPKFAQTPNVYLISFDALIPEPIAHKFLNIEELKYISVMRQEGLRVLGNVFADRVPTRESINSLVAMDLSHFDKAPRSTKFLFATDAVPSPLYELFRRNGYKTQAVYASSYFGPRWESNLDYYGIAQEGGVCFHIDEAYALMGYCSPVLARFRAQFFKSSKSPYPEYLFKRIKTVAKSSDKWLTVAYIYSPGHTEKSFSPSNPKDLKKYRREFVSKRDVEAARYMQRLIRTVRENDPNAVLIIFGDHGAWMSRGLPEKGISKSKKDRPDKSPMSPQEVFLDRHAVAAAVYPKDFCPEEFKEPFSVVRIGRSVVKCLSSGKDPFPADYQTNDDHYLKYQYENQEVAYE